MSSLNLLRHKVDISTLAEKSNMLRSDLFSCTVYLNAFNAELAANKLSDAKKTLKEIQELMSDLNRKLVEDTQTTT